MRKTNSTRKITILLSFFLFSTFSAFAEFDFKLQNFGINISKSVKKDTSKYNTLQEIQLLNQLNSIKTFSEESSDLLFYANRLIKKHIDFDKLVDFSLFCDKCRESIYFLDELAFKNTTEIDRHTALYFELCKLAALLHDEQTFIKLPADIIDNLDIYAVNFATIDKKLVITALGSMYTNYMNKLGSEVVEINGYSVDDVHTALKSITNYSTETYAIKQTDYQLNIREALFSSGIGSRDGKLTVKLADNSILIFEALPYTSFKQINFTVLNQKVPKTLYSESWYEGWDLTNECLFVKYNINENSKDYSVSNFTNDVFTAYDANMFNTMIIDLRANTGGKTELFKPFINKLKKKIDEKKCSAYVLIGSGTSSSSVNNVMELKKAGCILVGTPTGGSINYYDGVQSFVLPNSKIIATFTTKHCVQDKNPSSKSILPDVYIDFSLDDYILGNDPQTEWILANEKHKKY